MTTTVDSAGRGILISENNASTAQSAVSWAAIIAGAVAAIATTMILIVLGTGVGLSTVSPWPSAGATATTVGVSAVIWLIVVQWISSGIGGFLAGRLRTKWVRVHSHEVFFRDTAHGFLAWSLASVIGALLLASIAASGLSGIVKGTSTIAGAAASGAAQTGMREGNAGPGSDGSSYVVDSMFRSTNAGDGDKAAARAETARILAKSMADGRVTLSPADKSYLTSLVAARTGASPGDSAQRVNAAVTQMNDAAQKARAAADHARKRGAQISIIIALSMLVGAFIASVAAALGGSIRDEF